MPVDYYNYSVTVPTTATKAAPQVTSITLPPRIVRQINVRVPPGPRGEVGFGLGHAGVVVYPFGSDPWFVTDDEDVPIPLEGAVDSGSWQFIAYNTGLYTHTLRLIFALDLLPAQAAPVLPLSLTAVTAAGQVAAAAVAAPQSVRGVTQAAPGGAGTPQAALDASSPPAGVRPAQVAAHVAPPGAKPQPGSVQYIPPPAGP